MDGDERGETRGPARIDGFEAYRPKLRFLSLEPLLGPLPKLSLEGIHWVDRRGGIGAGARVMEAGWVRRFGSSVWSGVPFFFKQWGGDPRRGRVGSWMVEPGTKCPTRATREYPRVFKGRLRTPLLT